MVKLHPQGRPRAVVRLPTRMRQLPRRRATTGVRQRQTRQGEPPQGPALVQLRARTGRVGTVGNRLPLPPARPGHGRLPQQGRSKLRGRQLQAHQGMAPDVLPAAHARRNHRIGNAFRPYRRNVGTAHGATRGRPSGDGRFAASLGATILHKIPADRQRMEGPHPQPRRVQRRHAQCEPPTAA